MTSFIQRDKAAKPQKRSLASCHVAKRSGFVHSSGAPAGPTKILSGLYTMSRVARRVAGPGPPLWLPPQKMTARRVVADLTGGRRRRGAGPASPRRTEPSLTATACLMKAFQVVCPCCITCIRNFFLFRNEFQTAYL